MLVMQRWLADTSWLLFNGRYFAVIYIKFEYGEGGMRIMN